MNYLYWERAQPPFYVIGYWMPCPTDDSIEVKVYMVVDTNSMVYLGGVPFAFIGSMIYPRHFPDWRDLILMRGSYEWTLANDAKPEYFEEYLRPDYRRRVLDAMTERMRKCKFRANKEAVS